MNHLTLAIVARTLFSADVSAEADEIRSALTDVLGLFEMVLAPFSELLEKLPLPFRAPLRTRPRSPGQNHLPHHRRTPSQPAAIRAICCPCCCSLRMTKQGV